MFGEVWRRSFGGVSLSAAIVVMLMSHDRIEEFVSDERKENREVGEEEKKERWGNLS